MTPEEIIEYVIMGFRNDISNIEEQRKTVVESIEETVAMFDARIADIQVSLDAMLRIDTSTVSEKPEPAPTDGAEPTP
jgi:hypothetical protein